MAGNRRKLTSGAGEYGRRATSALSPWVLLTGLLLAVCGSSPPSLTAEVIDRVVAVVNDDVISLYELNRQMTPYLERVKTLGYPPDKEREVRFKIREDVLNQLIDQKLTDQETQRATITVTDKEIDSTIERVKEKGRYSEEDLIAALKTEGYTLSEYRNTIKEQLLRSKLVNLKVKSKIVITREDIERYYEQHPEIYQTEKKYHLRNILFKIPPVADEPEKQSIKRRLESLASQARTGASFTALARQYSEAPGAQDGGDLGLFALKDISVELQAAISPLKEGDISPVMETDQGFQIFYVEKIQDAAQKSLEEVSEEIQEKLFNQVVNDTFKTWLTELRKQSHIKVVY